MSIAPLEVRVVRTFASCVVRDHDRVSCAYVRVLKITRMASSVRVCARLYASVCVCARLYESVRVCTRLYESVTNARGGGGVHPPRIRARCAPLRCTHRGWTFPTRAAARRRARQGRAPPTKGTKRILGASPLTKKAAGSRGLHPRAFFAGRVGSAARVAGRVGSG